MNSYGRVRCAAAVAVAMTWRLEDRRRSIVALARTEPLAPDIPTMMEWESFDEVITVSCYHEMQGLARMRDAVALVEVTLLLDFGSSGQSILRPTFERDLLPALDNLLGMSGQRGLIGHGQIDQLVRRVH